MIKTALTLEVRGGHVRVFMPPLTRIESYAELTAQVEDTARALGVAVAIEGYPPPRDARVNALLVTPDPGVIEVNIHPAASWRDLIETTTVLYEEARQTRLGDREIHARRTPHGDGRRQSRHARRRRTPPDSPLLAPAGPAAKPDHLLAKPSGVVVSVRRHVRRSDVAGAARRRGARRSHLRARDRVSSNSRESRTTRTGRAPPWLTDRLLRNLLTDLTGNTHRAEFSIDKLYSPDSPTGRLGLLEFRAFEMPPHAQMSAVQMLLLRALVARFWHEPYEGALIRWGTALHDRWLLPHFVAADMRDVVIDLESLRLRVLAALVRAVRRIPLPALRHRELRRRDDRVAAGDRAVACARRGDRARAARRASSTRRSNGCRRR